MRIHISDQFGSSIQNGMIGLFFEDINYGLDGGLHAEMIENRSFEFVEASGDWDSYVTKYDGLYGWSAYPISASGAELQIKTTDPQNQINPHYLEFTGSDTQRAFSNKAYDGICMKKDVSYKVSFYAKAEKYQGEIEMIIAKDENIILSSVITNAVSSEWTKYQTEFISNETISYGRFIIRLKQSGTVCFDFISMIPSDAILGLFRKDLAELLKDLNPGFLRFPGGCVVEGNTLNNRYQWKKSIGKAEERKANWNRWAVHGSNKANDFTSKYSHYNQSLGIGYYEYFLLCEYLGAKALPVLNVGLACQYQSTQIVKTEDPAFHEFVQDAIDLIEFANGTTDSEWGSIRMQMGHPEPFGLEMIGVGNEQWETEQVDFFRRYEIFEQAIHEQYPTIKLIGSAGPDVTTEKFTAAWEFYNENANKKDFVYAVDEHYYLKPEWFHSNVHFYDKYPRNVKVFAGEYAAHNSYDLKHTDMNDWAAALSEAAFLTGIERNADVVVLASYAPLFARLNYTQWAPDMIWFDGEKCYGSPSYYVQKMYSTQMGTDLLQVIHDIEEIPYSVSYDKETQVIIVKLVNCHGHSMFVDLETKFSLVEDGEAYILQGSDNDVNSIEEPYRIVPVHKQIKVSDNMHYEMKAKSFHVIRMYCKNGK